MRKGTTQPTQDEISEDTDPMPEREEPRRHALCAPSNAHDAANHDITSEDLTVADFSNLVRFSSAAIGCVAFAHPISCDVSPETFTDLLYSVPSRCLHASVSMAYTVGLTSPDLLSNKPLSYLFPEHRGFTQMFCEWRRRNLTREGFECEILDRHGHHSVLHVALYGHIEKQHLHRLWIVTRDISALSRAIQRSIETERQYQELLNRPGIFFFRTHLDGTISSCTPSTESTLLIDLSKGGTLEDILTRSCHPDDRPALEQLSFHRRTLDRQPLHVSLRLISRTRGLLRVTLYQNARVISGEVASYDVIGMENAVARDSSDKMLAPETLAAGFAHDVNNHLMVASATIERARAALDAHHPAVGLLKTALNAISQSAAINTQTISLAGGIHARPVSIKVDELFRDIAHQCSAILPSGIALTLSPGIQRLTAWVDETHIREILLNLLINARDALRGSGVLTLSATPKGVDARDTPERRAPTVCISVSDNGPGVDEVVARTLFTPFVSTKSHGTPRGLGLAMVRTLVEANGGSISVTSAQGIGTTFTVCLPIPPDHVRSRGNTRTVRSRRSPKQHLSVLIADDEPEVRQTILSALTSRGHQCAAVGDLTSLQRELARLNTIDVVFLDGGLTAETLEELLVTTRARHPHVEILITSGDPTAYAHIAGTRHTYRFLPKPFSLSELYDAVESANE